MATTKLTGTLLRDRTVPTVALGGGVVSGSAQVISLLPEGAVSSSTQLPAGTVSGSAQVISLLPASTVSSSAQLPAGTVSGSAQVISLLPAGAVSSSTQLPAGTVSGSAQVASLLPEGAVSSSAQIDYNSVANKLSGVVSGAAQVTPLLPASTVSSSAQITLTSISGTTFAESNFTFPQNLTVGSTLTAERFQTEYISSSIIYESGSTKFGDTSNDVHAFTGSLATSGSIAVLTTLAVTGAVTLDSTLAVTGNTTITGNLTVNSGSSAIKGNVGINNTIPSASLHISGTTMIQQIAEKVIVTGSAPTATTNIDITSGSIHYRSGSTTAHWTINFRGDVGTVLNNVMYPNQSTTTTVIVNHGGTPYSASAHQIDGVAITPRWQSGLVPSASGTSTDFYTYTIIKLASASYNLFASQTKFS